MAISPVKVAKSGKSGGGGIGGLIGTVLGAVAAPFTGGASLLPAIATGAGIGSTVGSTIGGLAAPGQKAAEDVPVQPSDALSRSLGQATKPSMSSGDDHSAVLEQSLHALKDMTPDMKETYGPPLFKAYTLSIGGKRYGGD